MSQWMTIEVNDENAYGRESTTLIVGGLGAGAAGGLLALLAGNGQAELLALSFGALLGLLMNLRDPKQTRGSLRLVMAIIAGTVMALLLPYGLIYGGAAGGVLLGVAIGLGKPSAAGARRVLEAVIYGVVLMAGVFTTGVLFGRGFLAFADVPMLRPVLEGSIWGLFLALAAGINRLEWPNDEVGELFDDALAELGPEEREVLRAGKGLYTQVIEDLGEDGVEPDVVAQAEAIARETAEHLVEMARRTHDLRRLIARGGARAVDARYESIRTRAESAKDVRVKAELEAVLAELDEQREMGQSIELACARLEARQQRCLTALERLHLTLVHNSAALSRSEGLQQALASLQRLTEEMQWKSLPVEALLETAAGGDPDVGVDASAPIERNVLDERGEDAHLEECEDSSLVSSESQDHSEEPREDVIECCAGAERPV